MTQRSPNRPRSRIAAEWQARRATATLFAKIAADRRRMRGGATGSSHDLLIDLVVAMATYSGLTVAVVLGAVWGLQAAVAPLFR